MYGGGWIWDIPTFSLWVAIVLSGKIPILKTRRQLKIIFQGQQNKTNRNFFIFFGLEVTAFPRYNTVWWLLDLGHSDLFIFVGDSFVTEKLEY